VDAVAPVGDRVGQGVPQRGPSIIGSLQRLADPLLVAFVWLDGAGDLCPDHRVVETQSGCRDPDFAADAAVTVGHEDVADVVAADAYGHTGQDHVQNASDGVVHRGQHRP